MVETTTRMNTDQQSLGQHELLAIPVQYSTAYIVNRARGSARTLINLTYIQRKPGKSRYEAQGHASAWVRQSVYAGSGRAKSN